MTAIAETTPTQIRIQRLDLSSPILFCSTPAGIAIKAGTVVEVDSQKFAFDADTPVLLGELIAGHDYGVGFDRDGAPYAALANSPDPMTDGWIGGFHFAPGGCAAGTDGGDDVPAINPHSLWDIEFRPACRDARGMVMVELSDGKRFWADIYLLGIDHGKYGTSHFDAKIADGQDLPERTDGNGRVKKLDYPTASEIFAHYGKRLLGAEEFFTATYGVRERSSADRDPVTTGLDVAHTSRFGLMQATGNLWVWGTDGHPDDPRPSIFGGSWIDGGYAGSRCAYLDYWPGHSDDSFSARGACDHLNPV